MSSSWTGLARGAVAGAAGTTARGTTTYLGGAVRGRAAGPETLRNPWERTGRLSAPGPLAATATGVAIGSAAGVLRAAGLRLPTVIGGPLLGLAAMAAAGGPLTAWRISGPRTWSTTDWVADVVPHLVYGVATHATLVAVSRVAESREPVPPGSPATLLRAAALGAATGSRSTAGVTAIALTSGRDDPGAVAARLGSRSRHGDLRAGRRRRARGRQAAGHPEPARSAGTAAPGRAGCHLCGGDGPPQPVRHDTARAGRPGLRGAAAALGVRLRAAAARRFGSDKPGAFAEDAIATLLGWLGARRAGHRAALITAEPLAR
ncbi:hypothetical protein ACQPWY_18335 [Pseudonocardia xinjiangensis]|uniref:hypothetical protein n=1 Tax=Pseudonocardia xinjiangensis TaxID=75289 RepID=UPI003D911FC2